MLASQNGHLECVTELLNKGARVDMQKEVSAFLGCTQSVCLMGHVLLVVLIHYILLIRLCSQ